jgi:hypothetical protein
MLGRWNCQRFLQSSFLVPATNIVVDKSADKSWASIINNYGARSAESDELFLPVIPHSGGARNVALHSDRHLVSDVAIEELVSLIKTRTRALTTIAMKQLPWWIRLWIQPQVYLGLCLSRHSVYRALNRALGSNATLVQSARSEAARMRI